MMKKQMLLLAFMLCGQLTLFSQYTVTGIVKDENGNALVGANVVITNSTNGATTDIYGKYTLSIANLGNYSILASYIGCENSLTSIEVKSNLVLDFILQTRVYLADEVIVRALRVADNSPVTKSTVSKEEIAGQNLGQDVPFLLALQPSVITSSDAGNGVGYTSFRIRGTDISRINVTVNGIPLNDAESHGVYWVDLPDIASSVENIQIQRGVGTSTQGAGAFGASINLQTLSINKKAYAQIANSAGSFNTFKHAVSFGSGLINNHFTFDGRLSKITSDGFIDRAWSKLKSFYVSGAYYSNNTLIKLNVFSGTENTYQAWDGIPGDILKTNRTYNGIGAYTDANGVQKYYSNETDNYQQDYYQFHVSHAFSQNLNLNVSGFYTRGLGYYEQYRDNDKLSKYQLSNVIIGNDTIKKSDIIRRKWLDNDFYGVTWSLNYSRNSLEVDFGGGLNQYLGRHYGKVLWAQFMSDGELDHQYYYSDGTKNDFNVFGKSTYAITRKFSIFGDLQFRRVSHSMKGVDDKLQYDGNLRDISINHSYDFFNPKLGISFSISQNQDISGYVGVAHREPTRNNFVDADPSKPYPQPEQLVDYELSYNFKNPDFQAGVNLYYMDYTDQLVLTGKINDVGSSVMSNVSKSYRTGIEFVGSVKFSEKLSWNANVSLSRNIINKFTSYIPVYDSVNYSTIVRTDVENINATNISFSPNIIVGSHISYAITKNIAINFLSKYVGKQYIDNTQNDDNKLDPYFVNDLRINSKFRLKNISSIECIFMLNNIFNTQYITNAWDYQYKVENTNELFVDKGFYPQAGRNFLAGIIISF